MRPKGAQRIDIPGTDRAHQADDPLASAARWVAYLYSGHATEQGQQKFSLWLKRGEMNRTAYQAVEQLWRAVDHFAADDARPSEWEVESSPYPPERRFSGFSMTSRINVPALAAMLLAVISIVTLTYTLLRTPMIAHAPVTETQYASHLGETRTIVLADGSTVVLGSGTTLISRMSSERRSLQLVDGQAYFSVFHDETRPFTVDIGGVHVRDIGTEFDILKDPDGVRVSVARGIVAVSAKHKSSNQRELQAGQQVRATLDGRLGQTHAFGELETLSWRTGRLAYVGTPLGDVVKDINRYRKTKIELGDGIDPAQRVTMMIPVAETDRFLKSLEAAEMAKVSVSDDKVVLMPR